MKRFHCFLLLAVLCLLPLACRGETAIYAFTDTWPEALASAVADTPLAVAQPVEGYLAFRDGATAHGAAVARDAAGYLLAVFQGKATAGRPPIPGRLSGRMHRPKCGIRHWQRSGARRTWPPMTVRNSLT